MKPNLLSLLILIVCNLFAHAAEHARPNIILIMADDVSWECFGAYGAEDYETPNIDALADKGIRFTNAYSTPICTPTRVKLMTGQYNFRNYTHFGYLNPKDKTFAQLLKSAGYKTAIAGKWQLNGLYHGAPDMLDTARPYKAGFDEYCLWQLTRGKALKDGGGERFWSPPLERNGVYQSVEENDGKYGPDILADFLCDFMQRNRESPFFVYYPMVLVHDPFVATPDTIGNAPRDQSANEAPKDNSAQKENFVAMVNYMDKIVGRIVAKVGELGLSEDTIILFTADNGTNVRITSRWNGRDIKGGKGSTLDMGTHVPLVAYWKGKTPEGAVIDDLIDFTDFYATFADAAGITPGESDPVDGRSFLPQLLGRKGDPRDWQLCNYQPYWGNFKGRQYVRNKDFKLYRDGEFFNVPADLKEEFNLIEGNAGQAGEAARRALSAAMATFPPAPPVEGTNKAEYRPVYPDWGNIVDPND